MALINNFLKSLAMPVGDLAKWLEEEHQIPVAETISKWNELTGMQISIDEDGSADCEEVEDQTININNNKKVGKPTLGGGKLDPKLCQHVFVAGGRKGQQCTTKPKGGKSDRCSAHKIKAKKSDSDSDVSKPKKVVKKVVKKAPKKQVKTDSENESKNSSDEESEVETAVKPKQQKKIPKSDSENEDSDKNHSGSDSESEEEDKPAPKKPAPKKKIQKKVPPSDIESGSESD